MSKRSTLIVLIVIVLVVFLWSGIKPYDRFTWFLEVFPVILGVGILLLTYKRFQFTTLCYFLIAVHMVILMVGGHYTYARVPAFDWIRETFELTRNHYDRLGHFAQGFVPAIIAREILIRTTTLKKGKLFFFIVTSICLSISAIYELIEWWVAVATGTAAHAFLGTQGDVWDTQWDMFLALTGAVLAQLILSKMHDHSINPSSRNKVS